MQYNREGTAIMARYELSKDDFATLGAALSFAAKSWNDEVIVSQVTALAERLHKAHSAYLDEDGND